MSSEIIKANEADKRRKAFVQLHGGSRLLEMRLLYEMWSNKDFKVLGFSSFRDYFEAPKESGGLDISRAWAIEIIKTYEKYVVELGMKDEVFLEAPVRKMYFLKDKATKDNLDEIISMAKMNTLKDLELERRGVDTVDCPHERIKRYCEDCSQWIN